MSGLRIGALRVRTVTSGPGLTERSEGGRERMERLLGEFEKRMGL